MKTRKVSEPQEFEWPDTLYVANEHTGWCVSALVGHESENDVYIPAFGERKQCVGVYRLVDVRTIREVRVVEAGCREETK